MEEMNFKQIKNPINSSLYTAQDNQYRWGVIDSNGNTIVPFGKYAWIDGFQNGFAKVISHEDTSSPNIVAILSDDPNEFFNFRKIAKQGIINESGEEVLPLEYNVWKFYGKDFPTIKYFNGDEEHLVTYEQLNPAAIYQTEDDNDYDNYSSYDNYDDYDYNDYMRDSWDAMTDGMYGDMPDGFDGDFDFLG